MSTYALVQSGVAHADSTVGGGVSPLVITMPGSFKPGSAFLSARIKDIRQNQVVQSGVVHLTSASVSPVLTAITAVDLAASDVTISFKQKRTNGNDGVGAYFSDSTHVALEFDTIASGDTIDVRWQVRTLLPARGANLTIVDGTHIQLEWDGTLQAGESIDVAYDLFDLSNFGNDMKEVLFRLQRLLAYKGENQIQDNLAYDTAGNCVSYRVRTFDSEAHAQSAEFGVDETAPLQTGELSRQLVTIEIDIADNDRQSLIGVLDVLLSPTPGVN